MHPAIRVKNLSKHYRINHARQSAKYRTLRDTIAEAVTAPFRHLKNGAALGKTETFRALEGIDFEVQPGEVVGIVGRNGAGKSTLLKVISRITAPTQGRVELRGRVGSLLEVGTGFHPELTGRENVFLNGSILGMTRLEIGRQFDAIVDFSGVEQFLDTPVKRYSSGMRVRLAFAVAAHLDPELMLVDEVLAVGDAAFQAKCLAKMGDVASSGRTILFVSHNMAAVQNLCSRAILLEKGRLVRDDHPADVIEAYLKSFSTTLGHCDLTDANVERSGTGAAKLQHVELCTLAGQPTAAIAMGDGLRVRLQIHPQANVRSAGISINVINSSGQGACVLDSIDTAGFQVDLHADRPLSIDCEIPSMNLMPGTYRLTLSLIRQAGCKTEVLDNVSQAVSFEIIPKDIFHTGRIPKGPGILFLQPNWCTNNRQRANSYNQRLLPTYDTTNTI